MIKILVTLICLLAFEAHAAAPVADCTPSRTSGAAPLAVFMDCTASTDADTSYPFHDLIYRHSMGDSGVGSWSYGANTSLSKNGAFGAVAAHIYENAGTYTWTVQVCDSTVCTPHTSTITVTAANTQWATTKTVCFTTGADFTGCPTGATQVGSVSNLPSSVASNIGSGDVRLLLRRGDTFATTAEIAINQSTGMIGAYGSGAKPIITTATASWSAIKFSGTSKSDWRVVDLDIRNTNAKGGARGIDFTARFDKVTVLRVDMTDLFRGIFMDSGIMNDYEREFIMQDSTFTRSIFSQGISSGGYPFYGMMALSALLGNSFNGNGYGEHVFRLPHVLKGVISNNTLTSPAPTKETMTIRAPVNAVGGDTQYVIISDNSITGGSYNDGVNSNPTVLTLKPQADDADERVVDSIVERNFIQFTGGATVGNQIGIQGIPYARMTIRNNLINTTGGKAHGGIELNDTTAVAAPDLIWVYNNTVYSADTDNDFLIADFKATTITNSVAQNNLGYAPNDSQHAGITCNGSSNLVSCTGLTASNNSLTTTAGGNGVLVNPQFDGPLTSPAGFRIGTASYAANAGTAVFPASNSDFLNCDDTTANEHIGAFVPRVRASCKGVAQ